MHISVYRFSGDYIKYNMLRNLDFPVLRNHGEIFFQGPENTAFLVNIHEPIIWRLHGLIQQANISRIFDSETSSVSVDPIIQIGYA